MEQVVNMLGIVSVIGSVQVGAVRSPLAFVHSVQNGARAWGTMGALARRPVATSLVAQDKRRRQMIMDAGKNLDQLDGIPGMPETIGVTPILNTTLAGTYAGDDLLPSPYPPGDGGMNTVVQTRGAFNLAPGELPEYSIEAAQPDSTSGVEPRDHATSLAQEMAQWIARGTSGDNFPSSDALGPLLRPGSITDDPVFRAATVEGATKYIERGERRRAETVGARNAPARLDPTQIPNLWLAIAHSSDLRAGEVKKVEVDGVPIALWRSTTGELSAVSDVCIHRGASLSRGWVSADSLVCPYHGFEFATNGRLVHMPGTGPASSSPSAKNAKARANSKHSCSAALSQRGGDSRDGGRKAPTYSVKEGGGWIFIFPDDSRPGAVEQYAEPLVIPEACSSDFRSVSGSVEIRGDVEACVENMLDLLHISYVHLFGNMQEPIPFDVSYAEGFDDRGSEAMATSQVTFRYRSGRQSFSKVVGGSNEVVVKNEFHLPYRAVIRVFFGKNCLKTIDATAVPMGEGKTTLQWKIYRNFAMTHPKDEGPINKMWDLALRKMMDVTLSEDKDIIESIYPEYQRGFINGRYDRQMLQYRKALKRFNEIANERANEQVESSLQMELLKRIAESKRGLKSTSEDRAAILSLIERLEKVQQYQQSQASDANNPQSSDANVPRDSSWESAADAFKEMAKGWASGQSGASDAMYNSVDDTSIHIDVGDIEGQWHLGYISNGNSDGWDFEGSSEPDTASRVAALKEAGGEARMFDWGEEGRPLWADTSESVQIIDAKAKTLTNRAVYKGWSGFTTIVQLDAVMEPLNGSATRLMVGFHKAMVAVGGMKVTFPHLQRFSPSGWLETTYMNGGIRIARGNKGSIFVLTRQPLASKVP